ncbi:MAG: hypothetical protein LBK76_03605 [Verrucomicrobiales bacterium]|nr:hypothetical protein [Verrucomicrobiales bacterium]
MAAWRLGGLAAWRLGGDSRKWKTKKVFHSKSLDWLQAWLFINSANIIVSGMYSSKKIWFCKIIFSPAAGVGSPALALFDYARNLSKG